MASLTTTLHLKNNGFQLPVTWLRALVSTLSLTSDFDEELCMVSSYLTATNIPSDHKEVPPDEEEDSREELWEAISTADDEDPIVGYVDVEEEEVRTEWKAMLIRLEEEEEVAYRELVGQFPITEAVKRLKDMDGYGEVDPEEMMNLNG